MLRLYTEKTYFFPRVIHPSQSLMGSLIRGRRGSIANWNGGGPEFLKLLYAIFLEYTPKW